jgi:perosamine synthetase
MAGANPIIVDIDEDTLTLTGEMLNRIKPPAKLGAIMPVHFGGNPSGLREIAQYCRLHGIAVIDDAAHALPAMVDGLTVGDPMLGTFATCFSFYPTKPVTTGEGGMLVSFSERNIEIAREMSLHGINADAYQRSRGGLYHYEVDRMGWKYNLPDILAALGRSQLAKSDIFHTRRQRIAGEYIAGLRPLIDKGMIHLPMIDDDCVSSWHLFVIRFQASRFASGWTRDRIAETLKERDVTTSMHYRPLHLHPFWRSFTNGLSYPNADAAYREILSLPIYPDMPTKMVERVVGEIEIICRKAMR